MGGYVMVDKDLEDDPRVDDLAVLLAEHMANGDASRAAALREIARDAVIGALVRLWCYADTYLGRHDRLKGASPGFARIEKVTALPASLLQQFPLEWLRVHEDGSIELPGYAAKNGLINRDQRREQGRNRTRKWRELRRKRRDPGDASPAVTDETSQRHIGVTTGTVPIPVPDRTSIPDRYRTNGAASPSLATASSAAPAESENPEAAIPKAIGFNDARIEQIVAGIKQQKAVTT